MPFADTSRPFCLLLTRPGHAFYGHVPAILRFIITIHTTSAQFSTDKNNLLPEGKQAVFSIISRKEKNFTLLYAEALLLRFR